MDPLPAPDTLMTLSPLMAPPWCQDRLCSKNFCFPATYPRKVCRILRNSIKHVVDGFHLLPGMIDVSVSWRWNVLQRAG